jgi:hypothetical protein
LLRGRGGCLRQSRLTCRPKAIGVKPPTTIPLREKPLKLLVFAQALLQSGDSTRSLEMGEEALKFIAASGTRLYEAEAHRLKGACLAALTKVGPAEAEQWLASGIPPTGPRRPGHGGAPRMSPR